MIQPDANAPDGAPTRRTLSAPDEPMKTASSASPPLPIEGLSDGGLREPRFGDIIENGWASNENPTRTGFFVREGRRTGKFNPGRYYEVTDGKGKFWELPVDRESKITVRSALSAAPSDGWVLVPREPTREMERAGRAPGVIIPADIYRAMLSAAPERVEGGGMDSPSQSQPCAEKGPQPFSYDAPLSDGKGGA